MGMVVGEGRAFVRGAILQARGFNQMSGALTGQLQVVANVMSGTLSNAFGQMVPVQLVRQ